MTETRSGANLEPPPESPARVERRQQILRTALALFAEQGYHETAISEIIERADIARGTFYLYFTGKRALFDEVIDSIFRQIMEQLKPISVPTPFVAADALAQLRANALRLVKMMFTERDACRFLLAQVGGLDEAAQAKLTAFYDRLAVWAAESLQDGIALGIVRPCRPIVLAHAVIGSLRGLLWAWAAGVLDIDEEALVDEIMSLLSQGLLC